MPGTLSVVSKLPHGLVLQLQTKVSTNEPVMGGGTRKVDTFRRGEVFATLKPAAHPFGRGPELVGGFAITSGVDADKFQEWMKQNEGLDAIENGFVFAAAKQEDALSHAQEYAKELSGLEPTDPDRLPAEFKKTIATADVGG